MTVTEMDVLIVSSAQFIKLRLKYKVGRFGESGARILQSSEV